MDLQLHECPMRMQRLLYLEYDRYTPSSITRFFPSLARVHIEWRHDPERHYSAPSLYQESHQSDESHLAGRAREFLSLDGRDDIEIIVH
jgi:hypothetical protein